MSSGLRPERSELAGAAKGGTGQFAESEALEPRREQAQRDNAANGKGEAPRGFPLLLFCGRIGEKPSPHRGEGAPAGGG